MGVVRLADVLVLLFGLFEVAFGGCPGFVGNFGLELGGRGFVSDSLVGVGCGKCLGFGVLSLVCDFGCSLDCLLGPGVVSWYCSSP